MPHGYGMAHDPHVYVAIAPDGAVTIVAHRSEMGTGIRTSLPLVIADEMEADWSRVKLVQAPGDEPRYGNQDTDGSRSMRHFIQPMRECGAAMRQMLETAAAAKWGVDVSLCRAKAHHVVQLDQGEKGNRNEARLRRAGGSGHGTAGAGARDAALQDAGRVHAHAQGRDQDRRPARHHHGQGRVRRRHPFAGHEVRGDGAAGRAGRKGQILRRRRGHESAGRRSPYTQIEGVYTVPRKFGQLGGIAVVASSTFAAIQGRDALQVEWDDGPNASYNSAAYSKAMAETAAKPGKVIRKQGDVDAAFKAAKTTFTGEYHSQHLVQASMEPLVAVARIVDGKAEVWAPIQSPYGARKDIAEALKMPIENVTVHVTLLGGGFGRKSKWDFMIEAALISQKLGGAPVLLQWTREDDTRHSFYHTTSVERIEMAIDDAGKVTGWRHRTVAPSIVSTFQEDNGYQFPIEYGMGFVNTPFDIPNVSCENGPAMAHTRIGWYRSVSNIPRVFAVQSAVCEAAHQLGRDPKDFLLELIGPDRKLDPKALGFPEDFWNYGDPYEEFPIDTARLKNVVRIAAEKAGWGKKLPERHGLGIAAHVAWQTCVATVVHAAVDADGTIRVPEATTVVDCGFYVNPERIRSQIEGAAVMGMSHALYSGITFKNGAVEQAQLFRLQHRHDGQLPATGNGAHRRGASRHARRRHRRAGPAAVRARARQCRFRRDGQASAQHADGCEGDLNDR